MSVHQNASATGSDYICVWLCLRVSACVPAEVRLSVSLGGSVPEGDCVWV